MSENHMGYETLSFGLLELSEERFKGSRFKVQGLERGEGKDEG
jgi:hypothetical protein